MPYADLEKRKAHDRAYHVANRERRAISNKNWRLKNPDKVRANNRRAFEENREKRKAYQKQHYAENRDYCLVRQARYRKENAGAVKASSETWRKKNRHKVNAWHFAAYHSDPGFRMRRILARRLHKAVKGRKSARTLELLGCSIEFLVQHLEKQFQPGMVWENYGPAWHVDHIKPCAKFDLTDAAQQRECFHYSNLQPLWKIDNLKKGAR